MPSWNELDLRVLQPKLAEISASNLATEFGAVSFTEQQINQLLNISEMCESIRFAEQQDVLDAHRSRNRTFKPPTASSLREHGLQQTRNDVEINVNVDDADADGDVDDADADGDVDDADADGDVDDADADVDPDVHEDSDAAGSLQAPAAANSYFHEDLPANPRARDLLSLPSRASSRAPLRATHNPSRASTRSSGEHGLSQSSALATTSRVQITQRQTPGPSKAPMDPTMEKFYPPMMKKLIGCAKDYVHLHMLTVDPFPHQRDHCFASSLDCAITEFVNANLHVEQGYLDNYRAGLLKLLYKNTSYYRSNIKRSIRPVVKAAYELPFVLSELPENCNSNAEAQLTQAHVKKLLTQNHFLKHGHDSTNRTNNIAHPGIRDSIIQVYYSDSAGIARKFPDQFSDTIPSVALAFVMTVIHNCIEEYASELTKNELAGGTYLEKFVVMSEAIEAASTNSFHWDKLQRNLASWAKSGW
ncbi:hypothetical protein F5878DRAFT_644970 [Lentinula raphanica]|uniref:DUF6532 domain-containing protein n=1 Tax=Lentinula raphanica TaxID=153919 RepID=A0AA38P1Y9_9AGAR|nr:hypothetical protein F5878DRAFT_644970 [Lentinula raphanica]